MSPSPRNLLIIITDKARVRRTVDGVGVIKVDDLNLEDIEISHTLGGAGKSSREC